MVDQQEIDANVTTKEIQNLLHYEEAEDVISQEWNVDEWKIVDDLLMTVAKKCSKFMADCPFLHESMMLERDEKLSETEKKEAEMLYEREKNGVTTALTQEFTSGVYYSKEGGNGGGCGNGNGMGFNTMYNE